MHTIPSHPTVVAFAASSSNHCAEICGTRALRNNDLSSLFVWRFHREFLFVIVDGRST